MDKKKIPIITTGLQFIVDFQYASFHKIQKFIKDTNTCTLMDDPEEGGYYLSINTSKGELKAYQGDWIIQGAENEFYVCRLIPQERGLDGK